MPRRRRRLRKRAVERQTFQARGLPARAPTPQPMITGVSKIGSVSDSKFHYLRLRISGSNLSKIKLYHQDGLVALVANADTEWGKGTANHSIRKGEWYPLMMESSPGGNSMIVRMAYKNKKIKGGSYSYIRINSFNNDANGAFGSTVQTTMKMPIFFSFER